MKEYIPSLITTLMILTAHLSSYYLHKETHNKIDNYINQERNSRLIATDRIMSKMDYLEENIKNILEENSALLSQEIEFNLDLAKLLNEIIKDECDETL